jgi:hypothetical protein
MFGDGTRQTKKQTYLGCPRRGRVQHRHLVKTSATRVSYSVFFKHQYIPNPQITPETLVMKAAAELTSALKGTVSQDAETADALAKVSELFQKIAASKAERAKAKEQRDQHRTHPSSRRAVPIARVENEPPIRQAVFITRVQATPTADDCRVVGGGSRLQIVECETPNQGSLRPPSARPNYISQDDDKDQPCGYNTRSRTTSIMQEAMLACINITKPLYIVSQDLGLLNYKEKTRVLPKRQEVSAQKMVSCSFPMTWLCEMANSVMGENGELLEYEPQDEGDMDPFVWKRTWTTRARYARPGKRDRHNFFHPPAHGTKGEDARCHVWTHHMFDPTRKNRRTEQNEVSSRGGQSSLPIRRRHANRRPTHRQAPHQQRQIHTWRKILHDGHQKFLFKYPNGQVQIHAAQTCGHAGRRHRALQIARRRNPRWVRELRDPQGGSSHKNSSPND